MKLIIKILKTIFTNMAQASKLENQLYYIASKSVSRQGKRILNNCK